MAEAFVAMLEPFPECVHLKAAKEAVLSNDVTSFVAHMEQAEHVPFEVKDALILSVLDNEPGDEEEEDAEEALLTLKDLRTRITEKNHLDILQSIEDFVNLPVGADMPPFPDFNTLLETYPDERGLFILAKYVTSRIDVGAEEEGC